MTPYSKLTREEKAARLVGALLDTTARFMAGLITKGTWKKHLAITNRKIDAEGLRLTVDILVLCSKVAK
jgi:hypothetical protein